LAEGIADDPIAKTADTAMILALRQQATDME